MRLRKVKKAREIIARHPEIVIPNPQEYAGKWSQFFKNNNSIYLEIGMGKGKFLIDNALKHPEINFIGIEKFDSVIVRACEKLIGQPLPNIALINEDALKLLDFFGEGEVSKLFLNFSDPWPKSRHAKRRLTNPGFLKIYKKLLQKNGVIQLKTDNQKLFEYSLKEMNNFGMIFEEISLDLHNSDYNENNITTEYEERFIKRNHNIYYLKVRF